MHYNILMLTAVLVIGVAQAQPGVPPPPHLITVVQNTGRLIGTQHLRLVLIENATILNIEPFTSAAGRLHLRFSFVNADSLHHAIFYDGDWTESERADLELGKTNLVGYWETFQDRPSFVTKWTGTNIEVVSEYSAVTSTELHSPVERQLVLITDATVTMVNTFHSSSSLTHLSFRFTVPHYDQQFSGISYDGTWTPNIQRQLQGGHSSLVGYWDEFQGQPSFVLVGLE